MLRSQLTCAKFFAGRLWAKAKLLYIPVNHMFVLVALCHDQTRSRKGCQVTYSQFGLAIRQNDHQARRRFAEWAQNEIAVVPDFHKRISFSDEAHFWLNGYINKQNCRIRSEAYPQVYVETPLHSEKLTVWCALWAGGINGPVTSSDGSVKIIHHKVVGVKYFLIFLQ
ncbi:DUF4817 domain-containing protein [Trichonephila clavipes]|nr:DUF4817 domain-containing protein [Trichonephila clavipes]